MNNDIWGFLHLFITPNNFLEMVYVEMQLITIDINCVWGKMKDTDHFVYEPFALFGPTINLHVIHYGGYGLYAERHPF